jgi:hypothetical protein
VPHPVPHSCGSPCKCPQLPQQLPCSPRTSVLAPSMLTWRSHTVWGSCRLVIGAACQWQRAWWQSCGCQAAPGSAQQPSSPVRRPCRASSGCPPAFCAGDKSAVTHPTWLQPGEALHELGCWMRGRCRRWQQAAPCQASAWLSCVNRRMTGEAYGQVADPGSLVAPARLQASPRPPPACELFRKRCFA